MIVDPYDKMGVLFAGAFIFIMQRYHAKNFTGGLMSLPQDRGEGFVARAEGGWFYRSYREGHQ
jgi:hypothetical protein